MILTQVNFSLSSACHAKCMFCPLATRGKRIKQKHMPYETATQVIDEVSDRSRFGVTCVGVGENGDCFLNTRCLDVLRYIRQVLPWTKTIVYTNMQYVTPVISDQIIGEHLIDEWQTNIDGCTPERYEAMKGIRWDVMWSHLTYLLELRNRVADPMRINVYCDPVSLYVDGLKRLGIAPSHGRPLVGMDPQQELNQVANLLAPYLRRPADNVFFQQPFGWAERHQFDGQDIDYRGRCCPLLPRIRNEAFIAPDGSWYACCYDANNENVLGNVRTDSVYAIATGEKRRTLLTQLDLGRFAEIGGPCRTVNCCEGL